jgi:hypothetical protein
MICQVSCEKDTGALNQGWAFSLSLGAALQGGRLQRIEVGNRGQGLPLSLQRGEQNVAILVHLHMSVNSQEVAEGSRTVCINVAPFEHRESILIWSQIAVLLITFSSFL